MSDMKRDEPAQGSVDAGWRSACQFGGWAALVSLLAPLATMVVLFNLGGPPETAEDTFTVLRDSRLEGLFRLELLTLFNVGAYYLWFFLIGRRQLELGRPTPPGTRP